MINVSSNEIHAWLYKPRLPLLSSVELDYQKIISPEEHNRIQRYKFPHLQAKALATRAFIRITLSKYHNIAPHKWQFNTLEYGKPIIESPRCPIHFNLSHSGDWIVCVIAQHQEIGIDVEQITTDKNLTDLAERCFSKPEMKRFKTANTPQQKINFFYDIWTLKESFIKAHGIGLSIPLDQIDFKIPKHEDNAIDEQITMSVNSALIKEDGKNWKSWLYQIDCLHKMAITTKAITPTDYKVTFFEVESPPERP